jgi:hypothetical protein
MNAVAQARRRRIALFDGLAYFAVWFVPLLLLAGPSPALLMPLAWLVSITVVVWLFGLHNTHQLLAGTAGMHRSLVEGAAVGALLALVVTFGFLAVSGAPSKFSPDEGFSLFLILLSFVSMGVTIGALHGAVLHLVNKWFVGRYLRNDG